MANDARTVAATDAASGSHLVTLVLAPRGGDAALTALRTVAAQLLPGDAKARAAAIARRAAVLRDAAPADGAATAVRAFAAAVGLRVHAQTPSTVTVEGDPARLAAVFATTLRATEAGLQASTPLAVPAAIADEVDDAAGLSDATVPALAAGAPTTQTPTRLAAPALHAAPAAARKVPAGPAGTYDGTTFSQHYGGIPYAAANGHGVTVAIPAIDTTSTPATASLADIATYVRAAGLATPVPIDAQFSPAYPAFGAQSTANTAITLAIESLANTAPAAQPLIYRVPPTISDEMTFFARLSADAQAGRVQVASTYTLFCEGDLGPSYAPFVTSVDTSIAAFTAAGGTLLASTGEGGGHCDSSHPALGVNFPASDPSSLAIGGTTAAATGDTAWSGAVRVGGGGGGSGLFAKPPYQAALPGTSRLVPDLAADADPNTGEQAFVRNAWQTLSGTAMATALVSGWVADAVSVGNAVGFTTSPGLGDVHARLYGAQPAGTAFTDVTTGSNGDYPATPGYDPATGLGVPNLKGFLAALLGPFTAPGIAVPAFTRSTVVPVSVPMAGDRRYRAFRLTVGADSCAVPPTQPGSLLPATVTIPGTTTLTLVAVDELGGCHVTSVPVTLDTTKPQISVSITSVRASNKVVISVGAIDLSGVKSFRATVVNRDSGRTIFTVTHAGRFGLTASGGHFEVIGSATDAVGNIATSTSRTSVGEPLDDRSFGRSRGWQQLTVRGRLDGTITASRTPLARLVYSSYTVGRGRSQPLTLLSGGGGGAVTVLIDGHRTGIVNLTRTGSLKAGTVPPGRHSIVLVVTRGYVEIDGFKVG